MKAEEQLQMAYMKIAELTEIISRLEKQVSPGREEKMRKMYEDDKRRTEDFYKLMMDQMREQHAREMDRLEKSIKGSYEVQMKELKDMITSLQEALRNGHNKENLARTKMFGRKSEKTEKLRKKDDDDRRNDKNDFDGTAGGSCAGTSEKSSHRESAKDTESLMKKLMKECKKRYPGAKIEIRADYSKQKDYTENAIYHKLGEYFSLSDGEYFVTRNGQVDINLVKVIVRYPEKIEEHIYETATVRSADAEDYRTASRLNLDLPLPGCCFGTDMLAWIIAEKYCYNTPFDQIVVKLRHQGFNISKSTLGDNIHRVLEWLRTNMTEVWKEVIRKAQYVMMDETPLLVGCMDKNTGERAYLKKYVWAIRANILKLVWFVYENGSRGTKAIKGFLEKFVGLYTTDGYVVYKVFDSHGDDSGPRRRSSCAVHQRRYFVDAIEEDCAAAMLFIEGYNRLFAVEYYCRKAEMTPEQRLSERLRPGSTRDIMLGMEAQLQAYEESDYAGCGDLMKRALKYMRSEWEAMQTVLIDGRVEISNNLAEQMMRHIKMNLKTASNIGSEKSALDNAFMFSVIESCKLNGLSPEKYIAFLLGKLKGADNTLDKQALLPCYCNL